MKWSKLHFSHIWWSENTCYKLRISNIAKRRLFRFWSLHLNFFPFFQAMEERPAEERPKPDVGKQAEIAFKLYDKDRDGYITKSEMEKLSKNLSKEQIDKVFARFDADGDGRLSYAEFRKMMNKWMSISKIVSQCGDFRIFLLPLEFVAEKNIWKFHTVLTKFIKGRVLERMYYYVNCQEKGLFWIQSLNVKIVSFSSGLTILQTFLLLWKCRRRNFMIDAILKAWQLI